LNKNVYEIPILRILEKIIKHDDTLRGIIKQKTNTTRLIFSNENKFEDNIENDIEDNVKNNVEFLEELILDKLFSLINLSWEDKFKILKSYYQERGKLPKYSTKYQDVNIGHWLRDQRTAFRKNKLSEDRIELLNSLDENWCPEVIDKSKLTWHETFDILKDYYQKHKELPKRSTKYQDVNIGSWLNKQQHAFRKNKLSEDRMESLNSLDENWCN
jgi:hypothetical protein